MYVLIHFNTYMSTCQNKAEPHIQKLQTDDAIGTAVLGHRLLKTVSTIRWLEVLITLLVFTRHLAYMYTR